MKHLLLTDIHTRNKVDAGKRLANFALAPFRSDNWGK
jgi:hypothetical protein